MLDLRRVRLVWAQYCGDRVVELFAQYCGDRVVELFVSQICPIVIGEFSESLLRVSWKTQKQKEGALSTKVGLCSIACRDVGRNSRRGGSFWSYEAMNRQAGMLKSIRRQLCSEYAYSQH